MSEGVALSYRHLEFQYPSNEEPVWKDRVERWYQLDAAAFGCVQIFSYYQSELTTAPDLVILASADGSWATDRQFAHAPVASPAKFVHTLPNIRSAPLFQLMQWQGAMFCFQNGDQTLCTGVDEAAFAARDGARVWIFSVQEMNGQFLASLFEVQSAAQSRTPSFLMKFSDEPSPSKAMILTTDNDLVRWMLSAHRGERLMLSRYFEIQKPS